MSKLDNKVVIVTGATGGIGSATAALFSREGARLVLTGRDEARLHEVAKTCDPDRTRCIVSDNANPDSLAPVVALAVEAFGGLDGVFANAGNEGKPAPLAQMPLADFDAIWSINVRGTLALLQLAVPHLIARGGGSVVVTSSIAAVISMPGVGAYSITKAALVALARSAAVELGSLRIRVNALLPGAIDNRMPRAIIESLAPPEMVDAALGQAISGSALQRFGTNEEMAKAALFLISDDSTFCTGSSFVADGGYIAL